MKKFIALIGLIAALLLTGCAAQPAAFGETRRAPARD